MIFIALIATGPLTRILAQLRTQTVVAKTQMQLLLGEKVIDVIEKGDLLTVVEPREDAYLVSTINDKQGLVPKENALSLGESIETYNQLIEESPRQGRLFTLRALAWWTRGDSKKALADYDRAIELGYKEPHAFSSRGLFHAALGHYEMALEDFGEAIDRGTKDEAPFINRAAVYLRQERPGLAMKDYDEAIRRAPEKPIAYQLRAVLHKHSGDLDLAIRDFERVIELDPSNIPALMGRGYVWFQKDYWRKAIADFTAVIKLDPNAARAYNNRGYNRQLIGDYKEALADYEQAIRIAPRFALAYQNKAWLLAAADDADVRNGKLAIEAAKRACDLNKYENVADLKALAAAFARAQQFEQAVQWQEQALELGAEEHKPLAKEVLKKYQAKQPIRFADFQAGSP